MKKIIQIWGMGVLLVTMGAYTTASNVRDFDTYVEDILLTKSEYSQKKEKTLEQPLETSKYECDIKEYETEVLLSPICFYNYPLTQSFDIEEMLTYFFNEFKGFNISYSEESTNAEYSDMHPIYNDQIYNSYLPYKGTFYEQKTISDRAEKGLYIKIHKSTLAKLLYLQYSFRVVPTYLEKRSNCSLTNYRAAISKVAEQVIQPGETVNINTLIANNDNVCKGTSKKNYLFYGGSCGASTQLFRLSLLMPSLTTTERHNHSQWWALYYGKQIMGDDAAMYENSQRFTIRNDYDVPIYFKLYEEENVSYLVGIIPKKEERTVSIQKSTQGLNSQVSKNIFNEQGILLQTLIYKSKYQGITYAIS